MVKRSARRLGEHAIATRQPIHMLSQLNDRDLAWLHLLSCGVKPCELHEKSWQYTKNRLGCIRMFFGARTTTQAVAMAFSWGIIR